MRAISCGFIKKRGETCILREAAKIELGALIEGEF
jgi:hypothetical protein